MSAQPLPAGPVPIEADAAMEALETLERVRRDLVCRERRLEPVVAGLPPDARPSARNLVHYLGLRTHDLEPVQRVLAAHGLSSLGHAESHVLANLDAVLHVLRALTGDGRAPGPDDAPSITFEAGERLRRERADALFGPAPGGRPVRIMATMPPAAATDYALVRDLLAGGMDCMRINCAHDGPEAWAGIEGRARRRHPGDEHRAALPVAAAAAGDGPRVRQRAARHRRAGRAEPARLSRRLHGAAVIRPPTGGLDPGYTNAR